MTLFPPGPPQNPQQPPHYGPPQPQYGQAQNGQPQYGQPQYGQYGPPQPQFPPPAPPRKSRRGLAVGLSVTALSLIVLVVVGAALAYVNRQQISDQFTVWNFESSATLDSYIDRSTMTERGEFLFKASEPVITADESFNDSCGTHEEGAGILGCYLPSSRTILLFDVTDDRLDGIEEVVASHEMLHAAWDRMSPTEQDELEPLLEAEADKLAKNEDFADRMEFYAKAEPGERDNELHSIIGTEMASISPALETHYAEYFSDRAALVELHKKSDAVFEANTRESEKLVATLDKLRTRVDKDYDEYKEGYDELDDDISAFNVRADNGSFASQAEFTTARNTLLDRQDELDDLYDDIQDRIDKYDAAKAKLATLNAEAAELNESINIAPLGGGLDSEG